VGEGLDLKSRPTQDCRRGGVQGTQVDSQQELHGVWHTVPLAEGTRRGWGGVLGGVKVDTWGLSAFTWEIAGVAVVTGFVVAGVVEGMVLVVTIGVLFPALGAVGATNVIAGLLVGEVVVGA
jgi:hypothetical protein